MTQREFDQMPLLLTRAEAMTVLRLDKKALAKVRAASQKENPIATKLPGMQHWRYLKDRLAEIMGLRMSAPRQNFGGSRSRKGKVGKGGIEK